MKRFFLSSLFITLLLVISAFPAIASYSNVNISDQNKDIKSLGPYIFNIDELTIDDTMKLSLTFSDIGGDTDNAESWYFNIIDNSDNILYTHTLGFGANNQPPTTEIFTFTNDLSWFSTIIAQKYFSIAFYETTRGADKFLLNSATVSAVPVPGAALLLGSGLLGVVALRRRRAA